MPSKSESISMEVCDDTESVHFAFQKWLLNDVELTHFLKIFLKFAFEFLYEMIYNTMVKIFTTNVCATSSVITSKIPSSIIKET